METFTEKPDLNYDVNQFFTPETAPFDVAEHCLYSCISGSNAYGMNTPESDLDVRGVVCPPSEYFFGLLNFEQVENQSKDICYYSLRKFISLAYKNNVHALEMLFLDPQHINIVNYPFNLILDKRDLFLSKLLGYSFGGYAYQQLMMLNTKKKNQTGRQRLVEKYGYDTKAFAHSIRLYRMGANALEHGILEVYRPDREELKAIRAGALTYEEAVAFGTNEEGKPSVVGGLAHEELTKFNIAMEKSKLPATPNFKKIQNLLITAHKEIEWLK